MSILEKVYAKVFGCYANITYGRAFNVLHDLTGAPVRTVSLRESGKEDIWNMLEEWTKRQYAVCAIIVRVGADIGSDCTGSVKWYAATVLKVA